MASLSSYQLSGDNWNNIMSHSHRYRGHRAASFKATDVNELVELRARQRTFSGAYSRTALAALSYALTILRLFDHRFYNIGLLFAVLGAVLFILAFLRAKHSRHDFADRHYEQDHVQKVELLDGLESNSNQRHSSSDLTTTSRVIRTAGQGGTRIFGRPFVTAGRIVIAVTVAVGTMELALLVMVLRI